MAVSYTPEQYKNVKSVADKMWSGNENFKAALNKKYWEGAYDSFISYKAPATSWTNMQGQVDAQTPANAQSLWNVKINTEAMKQYNPNYNPNVWAGVSWVTGTPSKPVISASVTPIGQQTTEGAKTTPVQPQPQAKTDLNVPTQPVSTPQAITPPTQVEKTTTITPEWQTVVKKETPWVVTPDYNVGKGREQEILTNLNTDLQSNEKLKQALATGDYETFKQNYGYDTADQTKKQMLDAFFQTQQPKNSESFFQTLTQWMKIENSKYRESPEARDAQHRFDIISPYKWASVDSIYNWMVNKIIPPGSKAYKDLLTANGGIETPEMLEAKKKLETKQRIDKINEEWARQNADSTGTTYAEKPDTTQVISDNIVSKKGFDYAQRYKEKVSQDPETRELAEQIKTDTLRKKEIERIRSDIFKNIIKEHPGITKWAANLLAKRETEWYDDEYNNLIDTLNVNSADLRYKTSLLEKEFDYEVKQAQTEEERAYQAQQQEQQFAKQKELAQFQNALAMESKKLDYAYQNSRDVQNFKQDLQKMGITDIMQTNRDKLNFEQQKELASIQNKYQNSRDVQNYVQDLNKMQFQYENDPSNIAKQMENMSNLPNAPITASWIQANVMVWGKNIIVDSVAASGLENANAELKAAWIPVIAASWFRDQTATIRDMANRYGIPFNKSNPSETAQALRNAGHQVADPGKSNHETGMAIDVYADKNLWKVTPQQEAILNKNGWFSAWIPGDAGHFEYRWVQSQTLKKIPESDQKRIDAYSDDYTKNPNVQSAFKFAPLLRQYANIDVKNLSSSQRQGIISDYAKALDPDSVVREGEYATVAKYSSSFGEKTLSEINQFLSGNGTLSDNAAKKVIDAINSRGKNYIEQEKNIRKQYIDKINRISWDNRGEQELVYPDYSSGTQSWQQQSQNPTDVDAILNEWNTRNQ